MIPELVNITLDESRRAPELPSKRSHFPFGHQHQRGRSGTPPVRRAQTNARPSGYRYGPTTREFDSEPPSEIVNPRPSAILWSTATGGVVRVQDGLRRGAPVGDLVAVCPRPGPDRGQLLRAALAARALHRCQGGGGGVLRSGAAAGLRLTQLCLRGLQFGLGLGDPSLCCALGRIGGAAFGQVGEVAADTGDCCGWRRRSGSPPRRAGLPSGRRPSCWRVPGRPSPGCRCCPPSPQRWRAVRRAGERRRVRSRTVRGLRGPARGCRRCSAWRRRWHIPVPDGWDDHPCSYLLRPVRTG